MTDSKNFTIGVLSTTAVILLVGFLIVQSRPQSAVADGMSIVAGPFVMTVGNVTQRDEDLLYLVNSPAEKLVVYRFDTNKQRIEIVQGIDLGELRKATGQAQPPQKPRKQP